MKWVVIMTVLAASGDIETQGVMVPDMGLGPMSEKQCGLFAELMDDMYATAPQLKLEKSKGKRFFVRCAKVTK